MNPGKWRLLLLLGTVWGEPHLPSLDILFFRVFIILSTKWNVYFCAWWIWCSIHFREWTCLHLFFCLTYPSGNLCLQLPFSFDYRSSVWNLFEVKWWEIMGRTQTLVTRQEFLVPYSYNFEYLEHFDLAKLSHASEYVSRPSNILGDGIYLLKF